MNSLFSLRKYWLALAIVLSWCSAASWSSEKTLYIGLGFHSTTRLLDLNGEDWERGLYIPWVEGRLQWGSRVRIRFDFINAGYEGTRDVLGVEMEESADYSGNAWGLEYVLLPEVGSGSLSIAGQVTTIQASLVKSGGPLSYEWTFQKDISLGYRRQSKNGIISFTSSIVVSSFLLGEGTSLASPRNEVNQVAPGLRVDAMVLPFKPTYVQGHLGWIQGLNASISGGLRIR